MRTPGTVGVTSPAAWSVLMSPVRVEVAEALRLAGPCSIADIARTLDRPADTLYRHVDALRRAGFVREAGLRKGARNIEQLFDVTADDFAPAFEGVSPAAQARVISRASESLLRATARTIRDSSRAGSLVLHEGSRNFSINYELSWLTPEAFGEVRALIGRLKKLMDAGKKRREGRLYLTLAVACPVTRKRGADKARTDPATPGAPNTSAAPAPASKAGKRRARRSPRNPDRSPPSA
jgi:DNA-binding transcriptional ArsR family regulator